MENSYNKNYYWEHKEYFQEYRKKHYDVEYFRNYRKEHPEKIEKARLKQIEKNSGDFIYLMFNFSMEVLYSGSTTDLLRLKRHFTGNSNIKMDFDDLCNPYTYDYCYTAIVDFSDYNLTRLELYYVEWWLKNNCYEEIIKSPVYRDFSGISKKRKQYLEELFWKIKWDHFDDSRYWDM